MGSEGGKGIGSHGEGHKTSDSQISTIRDIGRAYIYFEYLVLPFALYSIIFTPLEFGFYQGLPHTYLIVPDLICFAMFTLDFIFRRCNEFINWFFNIKNNYTNYMTWFWILVEGLCCISWDLVYKGLQLELIHYILIIRMLGWIIRIYIWLQRKGKGFLDISNVKKVVVLLIIGFYLSHVFASTFYYVATTVPELEEEHTWIGSLELNGKKLYPHFKNMVFWKRYYISMHFAFITMRIVGYGGIKPVNVRERVVANVIIILSLIFRFFFVGTIVMTVIKYIKKKEEEKSKKDASQKHRNQGMREESGPMGHGLPEFAGAPSERIGGFQGGNHQAVVSHTTVDVVVPRALVPSIYGEDGGCLRRIREISKAKITISEP